MDLGHSRHHRASGMCTRFMNLRTKEGRHSLVAQVLIRVCHMQTCANKKACSPYMNLRAHTRNEARSAEQSVFWDSSHDQCGERFTDAEAHRGLRRECNMKVCALQIGVVTTSICLNSGLLALLHVFFSSFLPSTQNVAVCLRLMSWLDNKHAYRARLFFVSRT